MNERAREVLVKAALDGVKQVRGSYVTGTAMCALGVLAHALCGNADVVQVGEQEFSEATGISFAISAQECPACGKVRSSEFALIYHLNDEHELDFLTIARKVGTEDTSCA